MSSKVEQVAQAICGDSNPTNILAIHRTRARLAIEALRDPTPEMKNLMAASGVDWLPEFWETMIDECLK